MTTAHAKLSASGSSRWLNCPGSVQAEEGLPDKTSTFAEEGSAAHELGENCLRDDIDTDEFIGCQFTDYPDYPVDEEMADNVQRYVDYVRSIEGELMVEQRVDYSPWVEGGFGTADAIIANGSKASIVDLKYGKGVRVDAEDNSQAMLYALGVLNDYEFLYEFEEFHMVIFQPRLDHISEHTISRDELLSWAEDVKAKAELTKDENAPFNPGEKQCKFCKAKATCRPLAEFSLGLACEGFEDLRDLSVKDIATLSPEELSDVLKGIDLVITWSNAVKEYAREEALNGNDIEGFKLVAGRSTRKWNDVEDAEKALRSTKLKVAEIFKKSLISPTQAEKLLGKAHPILTDQVVKPEGKPALVPVEDKRPAIEKPEDGFDAVA